MQSTQKRGILFAATGPEYVRLAVRAARSARAANPGLAIDLATGLGIIVVASAGNAPGADWSPASCDGVITVAAHGPDADRTLATYSALGPEVDVVAPGGASSASGAGVLTTSGGTMSVNIRSM